MHFTFSWTQKAPSAFKRALKQQLKLLRQKWTLPSSLAVEETVSVTGNNTVRIHGFSQKQSAQHFSLTKNCHGRY